MADRVDTTRTRSSISVLPHETLRSIALGHRESFRRGSALSPDNGRESFRRGSALSPDTPSPAPRMGTKSEKTTTTKSPTKYSMQMDQPSRLVGEKLYGTSMEDSSNVSSQEAMRFGSEEK